MVNFQRPKILLTNFCHMLDNIILFTSNVADVKHFVKLSVDVKL